MNILVFGGTRGIGSVIVKALEERGDKVITASRSKIDSTNHIEIDISEVDRNKISGLSDIDHVVFAHRYRGDSWDDEFQITVKSVHEWVNILIERINRGGSVVFLSSVASTYILDEQPAEYHASRASLESLMKFCAVNYGHLGIRFNCVQPSTLIKPENNQFFKPGNEVRKLIEDITPLKRMGTAEDIAGIIKFLTSEDSMFVTGNSIIVDGGLFLVGQESIARHLSGLKH